MEERVTDHAPEVWGLVAMRSGAQQWQHPSARGHGLDAPEIQEGIDYIR
jgi:hypothetical protein